MLGAQPVSREAYGELGLLVLGLAIVGAPDFHWVPPAGQELAPILLLPLPFLFWAAIRFGIGAVCASVVIIACIAWTNALSGRGPFTEPSGINVLALQVFLLATSIPMIYLSAVLDERRKTLESLKEAESRMAIAAASTDTAFWQYDLGTGHLWTTDHCRAMFGIDPSAPVTPDSLLKLVAPEERAFAFAAILAPSTTGSPSIRREFRVLLPTGVRWFLVTAHTEMNEQRVPIRISGIFRDVTERRVAEQEAEQLSERILAVQDEERQLIAADLHDSTAQNLVAIGLNLMMLRKRAGASPEDRKLLDEIDDLLAETIKELRGFTFLLHPPRLESHGLGMTLAGFVSGFGRRCGLDATLRSGDDIDRLSLSIQRTILRVVQEALTNVHRHASATHVCVAIKWIGNHLHLMIKDDGRGMGDVGGRIDGEPPRMGVGIAGMSGRMRQLGGSLTIRSRGSGTTIHAVIPVSRSNDPAWLTDKTKNRDGGAALRALH